MLPSPLEKGWVWGWKPNPANNFVTLVSKNAIDQLVVSICDVNGRLLMKKDIQINNYASNLDLDLKNGIYFVSIINSKYEKTTKKLVIAR